MTKVKVSVAVIVDVLESTPVTVAGRNGNAHDGENQQCGQPAQLARCAAHETHQEQARERDAYWPWTPASVFGRR